MRTLLRVILWSLLAAAAAVPALGQPSGLDRFGVRGAPVSRVDASARIAAHASEPSLAQAKANAVMLNSLLGAYRTVEFTAPGDYYFAGEAADYSAIKLPATFRHIRVAPGVRLVRHSLYFGSTRGIGMLVAFQQFATENEGVRIDGGGTLARMKASPTPNNDANQTIELCHAHLVELRDLTIETIGAGSGGKYGILTSGVDRVILRNIHFKGGETADAHKSDGYHHTGRAGLIDVQGLTGATTDNMVGIGIDEGANYLASVPYGFRGGTLDKVLVRDVHPTLTQAEPIRFFGWRTANLSITGATYSEPGGVFTITKAGGFTSILQFQSAVASGDVTLTLNVTGGTGITPATYTIASIADANTITLTADAGNATSDLSATTVTNTARFRSIHVNGVAGSLASSVTSGVSCAWDTGLTDGVMEDALFENIALSGGQASGATAQVIISAGGLKRATIRNVAPQGNGTHGHTAVRVFNTAASLDYLAIEDCRSVQPTTATASAHLIDFANSANGAAFTLDELVLSNNLLITQNSSNASCFLTTDGMATGAVTFGHISGANNRMECAASTVSRMFMLANVSISGGEVTALVNRADLANTTVKNVYLLVDAGGHSTNTTGSRSSFYFNGLTILSSMTNGLWGRVDVVASNVYRDHKGAWVEPTRSGNPSFTITPQWSHVTVGYGVVTSTTNDGAGVASTTLNLDLNGLARYANILGRGFLPRGYVVHETHFKPSVIVTYSSGTVGNIVTKLGTTVDQDQFTSTTGDQNWDAAVAHGTFHIEAPAAFSGHGSTANARTDTDLNTDRNLNFQAVNAGTGQWTNLNGGKMDVSFQWSMVQRAN